MMTTLLASTLFALLAQSSSAMAPAKTIEIARWSTYEMTLTATGQYNSPSLSVDLTGVATAAIVWRTRDAAGERERRLVETR